MLLSTAGVSSSVPTAQPGHPVLAKEGCLALGGFLLRLQLWAQAEAISAHKHIVPTPAGGCLGAEMFWGKVGCASPCLLGVRAMPSCPWGVCGCALGSLWCCLPYEDILEMWSAAGMQDGLSMSKALESVPLL